MPRSTEQILAHADELARRFAEHEPVYERIMDARALRDIAAAVEQRAVAERNLANAVTVGRAEGHTWAAIGAMLGTSGEAARQRYGSPAANPSGAKSQRSPRYGAASQRPQEAGTAQETSVVLEDDPDGGPAVETVLFGFDGTEYEIDLNKKDAAALRRKLAPFIQHAHKTGREQSRRTARSPARRQRSGHIRRAY
jgi:Lsr2